MQGLNVIQSRSAPGLACANACWLIEPVLSSSLNPGHSDKLGQSALHAVAETVSKNSSSMLQANVLAHIFMRHLRHDSITSIIMRIESSRLLGVSRKGAHDHGGKRCDRQLKCSASTNKMQNNSLLIRHLSPEITSHSMISRHIALLFGMMSKCCIFNSYTTRNQ